MGKIAVLTIGLCLALALAPSHGRMGGVQPASQPPISHPARANALTAPSQQPAPPPQIDHVGLDLETRAWATLEEPYTRLVWDAASEWNLSPWVLLGLLWVESRLKARAVNPRSGAAGLGQFLPVAMRHLNGLRAARGVPATFDREAALDPEQAVPAAAEHLAWLVNRYGIERGLRRYNGGQYQRSFLFQVLQRTDFYRTRAGLPPGRYTCAHASCKTAKRQRPAS